MILALCLSLLGPFSLEAQLGYMAQVISDWA
jgi:hypothetical protein